METNQNQKTDSSTPQTTKTIPSRSNGKTIEEIEQEERKPSPVGEGMGGVKGLNFDHCVQYLNKIGQETYGQHFQISPGDYEIIFKLLVYAIKDQKHADKFNINLHKGILLSGPVGCGKTTLMTLINNFQTPAKRYVMKSCREISFEFIKDGYETIHKYTHLSYRKNSIENIPKSLLL
jgi:ABC-type glutathione transport system ATPase component